ncbi:Similar to HBS1: Protein HBS1 (Drosophila melanogaster) [Cotesia congregata]|uniref:Similar to HBS1: Protein HBS1 (Drosophila melanogaster) n=1 Tax=Cotesia congregata TaxID=51543 RepID=A0A8J2MH36_COTCN|nr:Similar to HBS1: Protein HBS1 (Drosophila melanogaster) [Cotesia congregata]
MSRHRGIRSMNYSDEYDGYDDVYGHSVEDDYCMSPGADEFLFDRNKQPNIASFINEPDIKEDNEDDDDDDNKASALPKKPELSELDTAKLMSCIEVVKNVIGDTVPDSILTEKIIECNFDAEVALDNILKSSPPKYQSDAAKAKDRIEAQSGSLTITSNNIKPKLNLLTKKPGSPIFGAKKNETKSPGFSSLSDLMASHKSKVTPEKPKFNSLSGLISNHASAKGLSPKNDKLGDKKSFGSLAEMTAHHLKSNSPLKKSTFVIPKLSNREPTPIHLPGKLIKSVDNVDAVNTEVNKVASSVKNLQLEQKFEGKNKEKNEEKEEEKSNDWEIDLTAALRQSESSANYKKIKLANEQDNSTKRKDGFNLKELYDNINEPICSSLIVESVEVLECKLTSINLKYSQLTHFNKMASPFGKMLCKKWKSHKPYIEKSKSEFSDIIKPFDFSSPSPDSIKIKPTVQVTTPSARVVTPAKARTITKGFDLKNNIDSDLLHARQESPRSLSPLEASANSSTGPKGKEEGFKKNLNVSIPNSPRCQSPQSGRVTPENKSKSAEDKRDVAAIYKDKRGDAKEQLHLVVVGHVDAGKSTLLGRLLCDLGQVSSKLIHKYQQESKKIGKQSFAYAWVLDETGEERERGITMDVGYTKCFTDSSGSKQAGHCRLV